MSPIDQLGLDDRVAVAELHRVEHDDLAPLRLVSRRTVCEPMYPAPPVTRMLMRSLPTPSCSAKKRIIRSSPSRSSIRGRQP